MQYGNRADAGGSADGFEMLGVLWGDPEEEIWRVEPTDGLVVVGVEPYDATWMPPDWRLKGITPLGFEKPHLDCWFYFAVRCVEKLAEVERDPDAMQRSPGNLVDARAWVAAAFVIVRYLGFPGAPTEPRTPIDFFGCMAVLRDVWNFLDRAFDLVACTAALWPGRAPRGRAIGAGVTGADRVTGKADNQAVSPAVDGRVDQAVVPGDTRPDGGLTTPEDGPTAECRAWFRDKKVDFPSRAIRLLIEHMWSHDEASNRDLFDAEVFDTDMQPASVRTRVCEANDVLETARVPWQLHTKTERVFKRSASYPTKRSIRREKKANKGGGPRP
jgi:hypothetical protein